MMELSQTTDEVGDTFRKASHEESLEKRKENTDENDSLAYNLEIFLLDLTSKLIIWLYPKSFVSSRVLFILQYEVILGKIFNSFFHRLLN